MSTEPEPDDLFGEDGDFPPEGEAPPRPKAQFVIDSESAAAWYVRKMVAYDREKADVAAQAKARLAEIESQQKGLRDRYEAQLRAWATVETERRRRKSITLLSGTVAFRTVPGGIKIVDKEAALEAARGLCPEAIRTKTEVTLDGDAYRAAAQAALEDRGELLPGVELTVAQESMRIDAPKDPKGQNNAEG